MEYEVYTYFVIAAIQMHASVSERAVRMDERGSNNKQFKQNAD